MSYFLYFKQDMNKSEPNLLDMGHSWRSFSIYAKEKLYLVSYSLLRLALRFAITLRPPLSGNRKGSYILA